MFDARKVQQMNISDDLLTYIRFTVDNEAINTFMQYGEGFEEAPIEEFIRRNFSNTLDKLAIRYSIAYRLSKAIPFSIHFMIVARILSLFVIFSTKDPILIAVGQFSKTNRLFQVLDLASQPKIYKILPMYRDPLNI